MKKTIFTFLLLIPTCLFGFGRKEKQIYNYLTSIDGMKVEIGKNDSSTYDTLFSYPDYDDLGFLMYSEKNLYYYTFLRDERVRNVIDILNYSFSGRQFVVLNDSLYCYQGFVLNQYSLDTREITASYQTEEINYGSLNSFLSEKAGQFFYYNDVEKKLKIIDLYTMTQVKEIDYDSFAEINACSSWIDYSEHLIINYGNKMFLNDFINNTKTELFDLNPVIPKRKDTHIGIRNIYVLENGHIQFIFQYHDTYYLCEYTVPEEYR